LDHGVLMCSYKMANYTNMKPGCNKHDYTWCVYDRPVYWMKLIQYKLEKLNSTHGHNGYSQHQTDALTDTVKKSTQQ